MFCFKSFKIYMKPNVTIVVPAQVGASTVDKEYRAVI